MVSLLGDNRSSGPSKPQSNLPVIHGGGIALAVFHCVCAGGRKERERERLCALGGTGGN